VDVDALYADSLPAWSPVGLAAWAAGAAAYFVPSAWGGTIPSLAVTIAVWWAGRALTARPLPAG
jgi:hypothetical protein